MCPNKQEQNYFFISLNFVYFTKFILLQEKAKCEGLWSVELVFTERKWPGSMVVVLQTRAFMAEETEKSIFGLEVRGIR